MKWKEKSIGEVLAMNVDEAVEFFAAQAHIHRGLKFLQEVGLGLSHFGPAKPHAQRWRSATDQAGDRTGKEFEVPVQGSGMRQLRTMNRERGTLYVLDEPTIGLHMADVEKLIRVLHRLVDDGNTVVIIEHNLDVMAEADWIIDLGPEGGEAGGKVVAQGTSSSLLHDGKRSCTAQFLKRFLRQRTDALTRSQEQSERF